MDEAAITNYITDTFDGVEVVVADGTSYFFFDSEHMMPFATLVTNDLHDSASNLSRPSVFRLNVGVHKETYVSLFGPAPAFDPTGSIANTGHDFTVLDQILPHPIYAAMYWVSVLNPSDETFQAVKPMLAEAYETAVSRQTKNQ